MPLRLPALSPAVEARAAAGKNFGVLLVPEGTIMAIPETRTLLEEMNAIFRENPAVDPATVPGRLTPWSAAVLAYLPPLIRQQLFLERESSGAVQLSQISTERMIADLVGDELARRKAAGGFKGGKYAAITHGECGRKMQRADDNDAHDTCSLSPTAACMLPLLCLCSFWLPGPVAAALQLRRRVRQRSGPHIGRAH